MKKTTKLAGLAAGLLALVGVTFTSCSDLGFGKDYFYGTWLTMDLDASGNVVPVYKATDTNKYYGIRWYFDGKSENLVGSSVGKNNGGIFKQHLVNYGTQANLSTVENETYWFGAYDIKGNSGYDKGKLYLYYQAGFDVDNAVKAGVHAENGKLVKGSTTTYTKELAKDVVAVLDTWTLKDFVNWAFDNGDGFENLKIDAIKNLKYNEVSDDGNVTQNTTEGCGGYKANNVTLQVRYDEKNKLVCSDIEYFRFNLEDASAYGYTRMMDTVIDKDGSNTIGAIYNQWGNVPDKPNTTYGQYVHEGTSWSGCKTRYMARIRDKSTVDSPVWMYSTKKTNSELFKVKDDSDKTDYTSVESDPEK